MKYTLLVLSGVLLPLLYVNCTSSQPMNPHIHEVIEDKQIIKKIRIGLHAHAAFDMVEAICRNGSITLSGFVNTEDEKEEAVRIVRSVTGIHDITVHIKTRERK